MYQKVASFSFLDTPPKTDTNNFGGGVSKKTETGILHEILTDIKSQKLPVSVL